MQNSKVRRPAQRLFTGLVGNIEISESPKVEIAPQEKQVAEFAGRKIGRPKKYRSIEEKNRGNYRERKSQLTGDDLDKIRQLCEDRLRFSSQKTEAYIRDIQRRKMSLDEAVCDVFEKQQELDEGEPLRAGKTGGYDWQKIAEVDDAANRNYVSASGVIVGAGGGRRHRNEGSGIDTDGDESAGPGDGLSESRFYVKGLREAWSPEKLAQLERRKAAALEFLDVREDTAECKICGQTLKFNPDFDPLHYKVDEPYDESVMHILNHHADFMPHSGRRPRNFRGVLKFWNSVRNETIARFIRPLSLKPDALEWASVECLFCGEYFRDFHQAVNHFVSSHMTASKVRLWDGKTFKKETQVRRGRRAHIYIKDSLDAANPFLCYKCWTAKGSYNEIRRHVLEKHGSELDFLDVTTLEK